MTKNKATHESNPHQETINPTQAKTGKKMRKFILALFTSMTALSSHAEKKTCVVVHEPKGQTTFDLEKSPVVSFTETGVKMVCGDMEVLYPLSESLKITIEEVYTETMVEEVKNNESFIVTQTEITAKGCDILSLYTPDGKTIASGIANPEGIVTLSIERLPKGVYIIITGNKAFKIHKR